MGNGRCDPVRGAEIFRPGAGDTSARSSTVAGVRASRSRPVFGILKPQHGASDGRCLLHGERPHCCFEHDRHGPDQDGSDRL